MKDICAKDVAFANGCLDVLTLPNLEQSHIDLRDELMSVYDEETSYLIMVKRKNALRQCRTALNKLLKMHKVFQMDKKRLYSFLHGIDLNENKLEVDDLLKIYDEINSFSRYVDPYDLKVCFCKKDGLIEGELISSFYDTVRNGEIVTDISFDKINMSSVCTIVTPCVYAHELTHTQLQSNRGIVKYYENLECLSYFVQLVVGLELSEDEDTLRMMEKFIKVELIRLITGIEQNMAKNDDDLYDTGKYLNSTIKALKLFILYYNGSPLMRLDMLSRVQKIFDGDMYLEELLDYYGINAKVEKDIVKHLTR